MQVILKRRVKLYEYQSVLLTLLSVIHEYSQIFLHVLNIYFALNYLDNEKRNNSAMSLFQYNKSKIHIINFDGYGFHWCVIMYFHSLWFSISCTVEIVFTTALHQHENGIRKPSPSSTCWLYNITAEESQLVHDQTGLKLVEVA